MTYILKYENYIISYVGSYHFLQREESKQY